MSVVNILVSGRVQGVFFRSEAKVVADRLGIVGWARNAEDGSVEILAEGTASALSAFEAWCRRGPPSAHVEEVFVSAVDGEGCEAFAIRS